MDFEGNCDKCGQPVAAGNNLLIVGLVAKRITNHGVDYDPADCDVWDLTVGLSHQSRHFLPTEEGCEGSPSRAQYIEGQPRDMRGFSYDPDKEALFRAAYARVKSGQPY